MSGVAAYTRISRDDAGDALGVERQREEIDALAARLGLTVTEEFRDNDRSAMSRRPEFERLLAEAEAGRISTVLVWAPDRLYRRTADLERIVSAFEGGNVAVRTVVSGDVDLTTADGRMIARILGSVATREVERGQERLRAMHAQRARAGKRAGGPVPYGWRSDAEADVVRRIARSIIAGRTVASIVRDLNGAGVPAPRGGQWNGQGVRAVALRRANAGIREHKGQRYPAEWDALLSVDEQDRVESILRAPERVTRAAGGRRHPLSGVLFCSVCGKAMRHRASAKRIPAYVCEAAHVSVKAADIEAVVLGAVQSLIDDAEITPATESRERALADKRAVLAARLDEIGTALAAGDIDVATAGVASRVLRDDITALDRELVAAERRAGAVGAGVRLADLSVERQRAVVGALVRVTVHPAGRNRHTPLTERLTVEQLT